MGLLILIIPLLIYYFIIVPIIKKKLINKKIKKKRLKTIVFILLLAIPVADNVIGYGIYKILCYTNSGNYKYSYSGGWYIKTFSPYHPQQLRCSKYKKE